MSRSDREASVRELITASLPVSITTDRLASLEWDTSTAPVVMSSADAVAVLHRYLNGDLSKAEIQNWAEALESREDIEHEPASRQLLDELLFELANPAINRSLTSELAREWIKRLES